MNIFAPPLTLNRNQSHHCTLLYLMQSSMSSVCGVYLPCIIIGIYSVVVLLLSGSIHFLSSCYNIRYMFLMSMLLKDILLYQLQIHAQHQIPTMQSISSSNKCDNKLTFNGFSIYEKWEEDY